MVLLIPKEGLQRSPEENSKDQKPVQRMESKPKGLCVCMCMCVGVFVSSFVSLGMLSKRSHRLYLLICDSLFKPPLKLRHLLPDSESLEFLFNEAMGSPPLTFTCPHSSLFFVFGSLHLPHLPPSISKQFLPIHIFILTFHCALSPVSFQPFHSSFFPALISFTSSSSLSSITLDQRATKWTENDEVGEVHLAACKRWPSRGAAMKTCCAQQPAAGKGRGQGGRENPPKTYSRYRKSAQSGIICF